MNTLEMNMWLGKMENMAVRVEIMLMVPRIKKDTVLKRWRRMVAFAIANGYGK